MINLMRHMPEVICRPKLVSIRVALRQLHRICYVSEFVAQRVLLVGYTSQDCTSSIVNQYR